MSLEHRRDRNIVTGGKKRRLIEYGLERPVPQTQVLPEVEHLGELAQAEHQKDPS